MRRGCREDFTMRSYNRKMETSSGYGKMPQQSGLPFAHPVLSYSGAHQSWTQTVFSLVFNEDTGVAGKNCHLVYGLVISNPYSTVHPRWKQIQNDIFLCKSLHAEPN